jgi:hypothetical protein
MEPMTPEQMDTFVKAAQLGVALGLDHRYEWYVNACRCLIHGVYTEIPRLQAAIDAAFLAFEKGTASDPMEEEELERLDMEGFNERIRVWYDGSSIVSHPSESGETVQEW